jgi:DNA-binding MarR family transcriptional regulator
MDEINRGINIVKVLKQILEGIRHNIACEFKGMELTGPQGMLIVTLIHDGEMKISDLSRKLGFSNSTVSGILDRLENQGIVERIRSEKDRRVVYINVTSDYRNNAKEHFNQVEKKFGEIINQATTEDVDKIFEGLDILKKLVDKQNDKNTQIK